MSEPKFTEGDIVLIDWGVPWEGGLKYYNLYGKVEIDNGRQFITYDSQRVYFDEISANIELAPIASYEAWKNNQ